METTKLPDGSTEIGEYAGDVNDARKRFAESGLVFPEIPEDLAGRLKEQDDWVYGTRAVEEPAYEFEYYMNELDDDSVQDYAILSHEGHGMNSYALQYYLSKGPLHMLLQLSWGGVYMEEPATTERVNRCFTLANEIMRQTLDELKLADGDIMTILCSTLAGWTWFATRGEIEYESEGLDSPEECLEEALRVLKQWK
jgi:hypothetical protein